ncbi:hypothetical protein [Clostridium sp.]|uniref:hypothetical protein n=1 Tax=Clostridium sp. TaxID=1506 RepID=UPI003216272E
MSSFDEFMGYDYYENISKVNSDNTTSKKLYVYYTGNDLNNYLIGEIEEIITGCNIKYIVKYYMETVKQCEKFESFTHISSCPYWIKDNFIFEKDRPYFIDERTPSSSRDDLPQLLEKVKLKVYDRFEYLRRTHGITTVNTLWVSDSPNDLNKKDIWWFEEPYCKWRFG